MPFSTTSHLIAISSIVVNREGRQRASLEVEDLKKSLAKRGLIHPLIVRRDNLELVTGERRLTAATELGWTEILCRFAEDMSPTELQIIELEENFRREPLSWQDQARAFGTIHRLLTGLDEDWTAAETADHLGISQGVLSLNLRLFGEIENSNVRVLESSTAREAYNSLARKDQREAAKALEELLDATPKPKEEPETEAEAAETFKELEALKSGQPYVRPESMSRPTPAPAPALQAPEDIMNGSFLDWAPSYTGAKFNLIHCDFPYGVNLFDADFGSRGTDVKYEDTKEIYFELLESFCQNLDNFCSISAHLVFWFSPKHLAPTLAMFRNLAPSFEISPHFLIWHKTDNAGIIADAKRDYRHVYETALIARRGNRVLVKGKSDVYGAPTDRTLHPSAKPEPMLKHFFEALVDEHTSLLDPTCGAGSALRAADALGASRVFGIEREKQHVDSARVALSNARKLRFASRAVED